MLTDILNHFSFYCTTAHTKHPHRYRTTFPQRLQPPPLILSRDEAWIHSTSVTSLFLRATITNSTTGIQV